MKLILLLPVLMLALVSCASVRSSAVSPKRECSFEGRDFRYSIVIPEGYHQNPVITQGFRALCLVMPENVRGMPHYIEVKSISTPDGADSGLALYRKHGHTYYMSENPALSIVDVESSGGIRIQDMLRSHMVEYRYRDSGRRILEFAGEFGREVIVIRLVADSVTEYEKGKPAFKEIINSFAAHVRENKGESVIGFLE